MDGYLRHATAVTAKAGPFTDSADGVTAETSLTIQKADVRLSKNGGDMAAASADQGTSDAGAAHDELGVYFISFNTTDTGTLGSLRMDIKKAGAGPVWHTWVVLDKFVYDKQIAGRKFQGTVVSATTSAITIPTDEPFDDDEFNGRSILITKGPGRNRTHLILDSVGSTGVLTLAAPAGVAPTEDSEYVIL